MKPQTYSINSLQDIANAITPKNIDDFLRDFEGVLKSYLLMVTFAKADMGNDLNGMKNTDIVEFCGLSWTDDGKHDITCEIKKK